MCIDICTASGGEEEERWRNEDRATAFPPSSGIIIVTPHGLLVVFLPDFPLFNESKRKA